jgi:hypothetical protein
LGSADKTHAVLDALAREIDDPQEAERFRQAAVLELGLQNG